MSRRNRKSNPPLVTAVSSSSNNIPELRKDVDRLREIEVRWTKVAVIAGLVGSIFGAIAGPIVNVAVNNITDTWFGPKLVFNSSEIILVNGRVFDVNIANAGENLAKDLIVVVDAFYPNFKFTENHHVHTLPNVAIESKAKNGRLEVKFAGPLGKKQSVLLLIDNIEFDEGYMPIFLTSVASDKGQAKNQGHQVRSLPNLTLEQYLKTKGNEKFHKIN